MPIRFVGLEMHKLKLEILPQIILIVFNNNNNVIKHLKTKNLSRKILF